ncbi:hypothetical protein [Zoogloea dura]|uniref:Type II secretion system protein GspC N-terminal domain-containing protein n=1 Tax=Zoogloea dura TaxID=2728840 RepID=A0A848G618_9RHOO|nr:hypothetical protein [Zoogloea dura]NML25863.1 hypothetical protein [Zoogloea dura]
MRIRLWQVLIMLDLALAGGLAALWLDEDFDPKHVTWHAPAPIVPAADSLELARIEAPMNDLARLNATSERPLFWVTRRPPPPPPPPEKTAEQQEPDPFADIRIVGLVDAGEGSGAMVLTGGKFRRVQLGEPLGAWILDGVEGMTARFKSPSSGELRTVDLKHAVQGAASGVVQTGGFGGDGPKVTGADGRVMSVAEAVAERRARKAALLARGRAVPAK